MHVASAQAGVPPGPEKYTLECWTWANGMNVGDCTALAGYYIFFWPTHWLLRISGAIFDVSLAFTLSSETLNKPFVNTAWTTMRNLANLMFIFILLYIAIATILRLADYKRLLVSLIIVALFVNFSAFFSRVVIDTSNILALHFYNSIAANAPSKPHVSNTSVAEKEISFVLINEFDPQKIAGSESYQKWKSSGGGSAGLFFVFLFAAVVVVVMAYALLKISLFLIARFVALMFLIIVSPLAFISFVLPNTSSWGKKWFSLLVSQAFLAPVFLVMLYIIATVIGSGMLASIFPSPAGAATNILDILINSALLFLVVLIALLVALKVTQNMSGAAGAWASKAAAVGVGMLAGGAGGAVMRRGVGGVARGIRDSQWVKNQATKGGAAGWAGRTLESTASRGAASSYDFRNIPGTKEFGKAGGRGGYDRTVAGQARRKVAQGNRVGTGKHGETIFTRIRNPRTGAMETMSATEAYTRRLERNRPVVGVFKRQGWKQAVKDREAARQLRRRPTLRDTLRDAVREGAATE